MNIIVTITADARTKMYITKVPGGVVHTTVVSQLYGDSVSTHSVFIPVLKEEGL